MTSFSRKVLINILLISVNLILITIIGLVVSAEENPSDILDKSIYLYYFESDDKLLDVGESQIYTFAPLRTEKVTIVVYGLDDFAKPTVSLYNPAGTLISKGVFSKSKTDDQVTIPYISSIQYTASSEGIHSFEVKNESGKKGLVRAMLFVGDPFDQDITLLDQLNPLLPSKAFMVAGDPKRVWENELTGEEINGLRTQVDVLPIERIDRTPDVFTSYSTLSYLPDINARLQPVSFARWFNEDDQEIYLVNIRPIPEEETEASRTIIENTDYQTYNSNKFFFFDYFFTVGNGSDPVQLDRGAGLCAGLADRIDCVRDDPNFGRDEASVIVAQTGRAEVFGTVSPLGEQIQISLTDESCQSFYGPGRYIVTGVSGTGSAKTCVPLGYIPANPASFTEVLVTATISTTRMQYVCIGDDQNNIIACTTGDDYIEGRGGLDAIFADAGNDEIHGGTGSDFIVAGDGNDLVFGDEGNDGISGGNGNDILYPNASDPVTVVIPATGTTGGGVNGALLGYQLVLGNAGQDTIVIDTSHDANSLSLVAGGDIKTVNQNLGIYNPIADNERDVYAISGTPQGQVIIYGDSQDVLDASNYTGNYNYFDILGFYGDSFNFYASYDLEDNIVSSNCGFALPYLLSNYVGTNQTDYFFLDYFSYCFPGYSVPNYNIFALAGDDYIYTDTGNDTIDAGDGNDYIYSNAGNDTIQGGAGNDYIDPGTGNDTVDGGADTDTLSYEYEFNGAGVTFNLTTGKVTGNGINTSFTNVENFVGTYYYDDIFIDGDPGNNTFDGSSSIYGTIGDTINYSSANAVYVNLGLTTATGTSIGVDTLLNIENIVGSQFADDLTGDANVNRIDAQGGDDIIRGDGGDDIINGNTGIDTIDYSAAINAVTVDLNNGTSTTTDFGNDQLQNIENIYGGAGSDFLIGSNVDNLIVGNNGDDLIFGLNGNDTLEGGAGFDSIFAGAGNDIVSGGADDDYIDGGTGNDTFDESTTGNSLTISLVNGDGTSSGLGNDSLFGIENVNTGSGNDNISLSDAANNLINGGAGTDTVTAIGTTGDDNISITRAGNVVTTSGSGVGVDTYTDIEQVNLGGGDGNDTFTLNDDSNNNVDGGNGTDTANEQNASGDITIVRSGTGLGTGNIVTVDATGVGTDVFTDVETVNVPGSATDDNFIVTDAQNNTFDAAGGTDTIDYSSATSGVTVTFNTGSQFAVGTNVGVDILSNFENATTGSGDDTFNAGDTVSSTFDGGSNSAVGDTYQYTGSSSAAITVIYNGTSGTVDSSAMSADTVINIENFVTGNGNDTFQLTDTGNNTLTGGNGTDLYLVDGATNAVTVTYDGTTGTVTGADTGTDTVNGIENYTTGSGNDTFNMSDAGNNIIEAGTGNDTANVTSQSTGNNTYNVDRTGNDVTVTGTGIGNDQYNDVETVNVIGNTGNELFNINDSGDNNISDLGGIDTAIVQNASGTITITRSGSGLGLGNVVTVTANGVGTDTYTDIETVGVDGSSFDDNFVVTDAQDNTFDAAGGTDTIDYTSATGAVTVTFNTGSQSATGINVGTDTLTNFENATTGSGDDIFNAGDTVSNTFDGGSNSAVGDTYQYTGSSAAAITVIYNGTSGTVDSSAMNADTVIDIENFVTGNGNDIFQMSDTGNNTLSGGTGTDLYIADGATNAVTVTYDGTTGTVTGADTGTDTVNSIENYTSGSGNDIFNMSDTASNIIEGGSGTDTANVTSQSTGNNTYSIDRSGTDVVIAGTGIGTDQYNDVELANLTGNIGDETFNVDDANNNTLDAVSGYDIANLSNASGTVDITRTGTSVTVTATEGIGTDTLNNFDEVNVTSLSGDDTYNVADEGNNTLDGGTGTNVFNVFKNDDTDGDIIVQRDSLYNSTVNVSGTGVGYDTYLNASQVNVTGGGGNDTFYLFDGLDNIIDGGAGLDTIDYSLTTAQINVVFDVFSINLISGVGIGQDTLISIENVITGGGNDVFVIQDEQDNIIDGGAGSDTASVIMENTYSGLITVIRNPSNVVTVTGSGYGTDQYINIEQVNVTSSSGDDTFRVSDSNGNTYDAGGGTNDTIDYSLVTSGVTVNLTAGNATGDGTDLLMNFENIIGSDQGDSLTGDANDNIIRGGAGDDVINGAGGTDTFDEGATSNALTVSLNNGAGTSSGLGNDTLSGIENVTTGSGNDVINLQDAIANIIDAGGGTDTVNVTNDNTTGTLTINRSGNDVTLVDGGTGYGNDQYLNTEQVNVTGGSGADDYVLNDGNANNIDGAGGSDSVTYSTGTDITIDFNAANTADVTGTFTGNDTLSNIEAINTGSGDDTFNFNSNLGTLALDASSGNNTYNFGAAQGTLAITDSGTNTLDFSGFTNGNVTLDLSNTGVTQAANGLLNLQLNGIFNNYIGSGFVDTISGTANADTIIGNGGNDVLDGGAGNDTLDGGAGDDILDGGAGIDFIDESASTTTMIVTLNNGDGSIVDGAETDTVRNIENVDTGSGNDQFFISDSDNNVINANGGTDTATVSGGSGTINITRTGADVAVSDSGGGIGSDQYNSVELMNVAGSGTNDTFNISDANNNNLDGLGGIDTVDYSGTLGTNAATVVVNGANTTITGSGIGSDVLSNIENIITGDGADTFSLSGTLNYAFDSNGGTDLFTFNSGVNGAVGLASTGASNLDFSAFGSAITIDLSSAVSQTVSAGAPLEIKLTGVFNQITGTAFSDDIIGSTGDDTIIGGAGNDIIDGNSGIDTLDESAAGGNFTVVMDSTSGTSSGNGNDTLTGIENIFTGSGNDTFTIGDSGDNIIDANGGTDTVNVTGASGVITLTRSGGGTGTDVVVIGSGVGNDSYLDVEQVNVAGTGTDDTFTVTDAFDNIIDGQGGSDTIDYSAVTANMTVNVLTSGTTILATGIGSDTLTSIENITTGSGDDIFTIEDMGDDNTYNGNGGTDSATLTKTNNVSGTITLNRSGTTVTSSGTGMGNDTFQNIEQIDVVGSTADDTFVIQDNTNNNIDGGANGSNGDTYDASFASNDVSVSIAGTNATATGTDIGTDTISNVENFSTGAGNDTFTIDTSQNGDYVLSAGTSTIGNLFQFTGNATGNVTVTISTNSGSLDTLDFSGLTTGSGINIDLSNSGPQNVVGGLFVIFNDFVDNIVGTANADTITGNANANNIDAGAGDDIIDAGAGNDIITAGDGNDTIDAGAGNDTIDAGIGDDTITTGAGNDSVDGGAGTDTVDYSGSSNDSTITLTSGTDTVSNVSGTDSLDSVEVINATQGDDTIVIQDPVTATVNAEGGTDTIDYSGLTTSVNIDLSTGAGNISGTSHQVTNAENVTGSDFDDTIVGSDDNNVINAGDGNDTVDAGNGNDTVNGGNGKDKIKGGNGDDTLNGDGGDDEIYGGDGSDTIDGGANNDLIYGGNVSGTGTDDTGADIITGGAGDDTIYGGNDNTDGGSQADGNDQIDGGTGVDTIYGGNNNGATGSGSDGNDTLTDGTDDQADTVYGGNNNAGGGTGNDGQDTLNINDGNNGNDKDTVYGGNDNSGGGSGTDATAPSDDTITAGSEDTVTQDNKP